MPEKVHRCAKDLQSQGKSEDSSWAICNSSVKEICEICNGEQHDPHDHPFLPKFQEHHNPLDIPFGHEVHEVNNNIKDVDEGGMGSGRNEEFGDPLSPGAQPGELVSFETVSIPNSASALSVKKPIEGVTEIMKQILDSKLSCPCKNKTN